jgi:hypothetical protein
MEKENFEDLAIDGSTILKLIFKKLDWINLAQSKDRWQDLVIAVMKVRAP